MHGQGPDSEPTLLPPYHCLPGGCQQSRERFQRLPGDPAQHWRYRSADSPGWGGPACPSPPRRGTGTSSKVLAGVSPPWAWPHSPFLSSNGQKGCRDHQIPQTARRKSTPHPCVSPKTTEMLKLLHRLRKVHGRAWDGAPQPHTMPRLHPCCWAWLPGASSRGFQGAEPHPPPQAHREVPVPPGTSRQPLSPVPEPHGGDRHQDGRHTADSPTE